MYKQVVVRVRKSAVHIYGALPKNPSCCHYFSSDWQINWSARKFVRSLIFPPSHDLRISLHRFQLI